MITVVDKFTKYSINESWNHVVKRQKPSEKYLSFYCDKFLKLLC